MPQIELIARGVLVKGGNVLLCHTRGAKNTYLPGGHVDFGESAPCSLEREMREELGVTAKVGRFLGAVEHTFVQKGKRHCEVNLVFAMQCRELAVNKAPESREEYIEFMWHPLDKLKDSRLEPGVLRNLIPQWLDHADSGWATTYE